MVRQYAQKSCGPGRPETRQIIIIIIISISIIIIITVYWTRLSLEDVHGLSHGRGL